MAHAPHRGIGRFDGRRRTGVRVLAAMVLALASWALPVAPALAQDPGDATPPVATAPVEPGAVEPAVAATPEVPVQTDDATAMARFLDRLMQAESGGRDDARNPRSTAVGPFQFIESTFIDVTRRHFAAETQGLTLPQLLARRMDRAFARRAAEAFTHDNAAKLAANGVPTTFANLRLAFFLGPAGAVRVLKSAPQLPVIGIVGTGVVQANPFMAGMTAGNLVAWAERNLAAHQTARVRLVPRPGAVARETALLGSATPGAPAAPPKPVVQAQCNTALPSCRRWVVLAERQLAKAQPTRVAAKRGAAAR